MNATQTRLLNILAKNGLNVEKALKLPKERLLKLDGFGPQALAALYDMAPTVVVTRHRGLVEFLRETGMIKDDTPILEHASAEDVRGRHVIGVLPLHLAAEALSVTEAKLEIEPHERGLDLPVERVREVFRGFFVYEARLVRAL